MLTVVVAVLLLVVVLLAIPVTMSYRISWKQGFSGEFELQWGFGLVRTAISSGQAKSKPDETKVFESTVKRSRRSTGRKADIFAAIRQKSFRRRMIKFVSDLWRAVHKKDVHVSMRLGLGDPADTGQLWAVIGPVSGMLAGIGGAAIMIEPEFVESEFQLDSGGIVQLVPLRLLYLALALTVSPAIWRVLIRMRKRG